MITAFWKDYERVEELTHLHPTFASRDHLIGEVLPATTLVYAVISSIFLVNLRLVKGLYPDTPSARVYKVSYQLTNFLVNLALALLGIAYHDFFRFFDKSIEYQVLSHRKYYTFSAIQFGYNLWALPVGVLLVKESIPMLLHHVFVLIVSYCSGCLSLGFNSFSPFMYGVLETSSVPLAIMNTFKDHPEYVQAYPKVYASIRVIFAVSFLIIRWVLFIPLILQFLRFYAMATIACPSTPIKLIRALSWMSSFFLLILQLYWGGLVVKGLLRLFVVKKKVANKVD
jgi:hypothetical protein